MTNFVAHILQDEAAQPSAADALFELHPAASLLCTRDGVIAQANAAARELLHAQDESLRGMKLAAILPEFATQLAELCAAICLRRTAARRLDSSHFNARVHAVPADGSARAPLLLSIEDLTEREQEGAAADREFESLTSVAGHDLRGPLRILKGFAAALEDECGAVLNEEGRNFLAEILKASDRMEGLIDGLLAFSRAARAEMARENVDLTTLIELVYYEMRHAQTEREVDCQVEPGLSVWADVRLIMTVLRGIIGNAWKYTGRTTGPAIRCHGEQRDGRLWICVTDNGVGFDMSQATRLFKPFTRLHRQDEFPGHGLGLATVERILKRHGGEIQAESAPGSGTTVRFWLPAAPE